MEIKDIIKGDSTIQGVTVHHKNSGGHEFWNEYDSEGNEIHFKNSDGYECWNEYDSEGNEIHFKDSDGYEYWYEYDSEGNEIHFKDTYGLESWQDSEGNEIEDPSKVKEVTIKEIAKKFGVSVESLRIKD